jgi:hypothetical protein
MVKWNISIYRYFSEFSLGAVHCSAIVQRTSALGVAPSALQERPSVVWVGFAEWRWILYIMSVSQDCHHLSLDIIYLSLTVTHNSFLEISLSTVGQPTCSPNKIFHDFCQSVTSNGEIVPVSRDVGRFHVSAILCRIVQNPVRIFVFLKLFILNRRLKKVIVLMREPSWLFNGMQNPKLFVIWSTSSLALRFRAHYHRMYQSNRTEPDFVLNFASRTFQQHEEPVNYVIYEWRHLRLIIFTEISTHMFHPGFRVRKIMRFALQTAP